MLSVAATELVVVYPDETLHAAIEKMLKSDVGRVPVVDRAAPTRAVGYLGRADILSARLRQHDEEERREKGPLLGTASRTT